MIVKYHKQILTQIKTTNYLKIIFRIQRNTFENCIDMENLQL